MNKKENPRTLYLTDLDGTLLTKDKALSRETVRIINDLLERGMLFSVATARSAATASEILSPLALNLPGILLNGTVIYDFQKKSYVDCAPIAPQAANRVLTLLRKAGRTPFLYTLTNSEICVEFERLANAFEEEFYRERRGKAYKKFEQVRTLSAKKSAPIIYFTMLDTFERLLPVYEAVKAMRGITVSFYKDNYTPCYYLEIYSEKASKSAGMAKLKQMTGAEKVVVFGDNYNDLDMIKAADLGFVVKDAVEEVKAAADGVIGSSFDDGVAVYLQKHAVF